MNQTETEALKLVAKACADLVACLGAFEKNRCGWDKLDEASNKAVEALTALDLAKGA